MGNKDNKVYRGKMSIQCNKGNRGNMDNRGNIGS